MIMHCANKIDDSYSQQMFILCIQEKASVRLRSKSITDQLWKNYASKLVNYLHYVL